MEESFEGRFFNVEIKPGAKFYEPDHPDRVLAEADFGLSNRAQNSFFNISIPIDVVDHFFGFRVVEEAVDGKISAQYVFLFGSPDIISDDEAGCFSFSCAKSRYLDHLFPEADMREAKSSTDEDCVPEEGAHFFGSCRRGDVKILGLLVEEEVSDPAADKVRFIARFAELVDDIKGLRIDSVGADFMFFEGVNFGFYLGCQWFFSLLT